MGEETRFHNKPMARGGTSGARSRGPRDEEEAPSENVPQRTRVVDNLRATLVGRLPRPSLAGSPSSSRGTPGAECRDELTPCPSRHSPHPHAPGSICRPILHQLPRTLWTKRGSEHTGHRESRGQCWGLSQKVPTATSLTACSSVIWATRSPHIIK